MKENRLLSSRLKTVKINYKKCHDSHILCIWVMYSLWDRRWKYHTEKKNTVATNLIKEASILCLTAYFGIFTACWYLGWATARESMFANPQEARMKPSAVCLPAELAKGKENKNQNTLISNDYNLKTLFGSPFFFQSYHYKAVRGFLVLCPGLFVMSWCWCLEAQEV